MVMEFFGQLHPPLKFHNMKTYLYSIMLFLCLAGFRNSANQTISGTVYDLADKKPIPGVVVEVLGTPISSTTDINGKYSITAPEGKSKLLFKTIGYEQKIVTVGKTGKADVWLKISSSRLNEISIAGYRGTMDKAAGAVVQQEAAYAPQGLAGRVAGISTKRRGFIPPVKNEESYKGITENRFADPRTSPLSTFAVDVDAASYSNLRRYINNGSLPPKDAVRIEEMINYFKYDLGAPVNGAPVAIHTELSAAPWNMRHRLLRIGLKAKAVPTAQLPPANFVFLIDVSGSMSDYNKLPLVKSALKLLVDQLRDKDQVAIVTYAGNAGLKLPATPGNQQIKIKDAIETLDAGGSTAGGAGIKLAYRIAREHFIKGGNNRIILATDGDFNVGESSDGDMEDMIAEERKSGVSLSVLGFGMGNIKDSKMETLADKGHGNYAYIDNISEARKAIVTEFGATLFTVAKDVKLQVEFNPAKVQGYRLLGYENRLLEKEDFNNDSKLGGDMGVGHTVTALYEIIPAGIKDNYTAFVDALKYQKVKPEPVISTADEVATIKFRYKNPEASSSKMQQVVVADHPVQLDQASADFRFASAVAELGMLLRNSAFKQQSDYDSLILRAKSARGADDEGYRAEFIALAKSAKLLAGSRAATAPVR